MSESTFRLLCFVKEQYPTHRVDVVELLSRELPSRGHKIDLVMQAASVREVLGKTMWNGCIVSVGRTCQIAGFSSRAMKLYLALRHDLRSLRLIGDRDYDAIQVRDKFLLAAVAVVIARLRGVRFFYWLSFPEPEAQWQRVRDGTARYRFLSALRAATIWVLLYRWILPRADHVFVQSERMRSDVAARGLPLAKLTPVPMGISAKDIEQFGLDGSESVRGSTSGSGPLLGYLGTLVVRRNLVVLIDMLAVLHARGVCARLLLVGDGERASDREVILRRADELGLSPSIEITGFLRRDLALDRMKNVDIALSPFFPTPVLLSTSPTKLVEYMAMALPVVANDHPEQRLILRESRAGVRVPWGARHFARGVEYLWSLSDVERSAMGQRGRAWVREFRTYRKIAGDLERTYRAVLRD